MVIVRSAKGLMEHCEQKLKEKASRIKNYFSLKKIQNKDVGFLLVLNVHVAENKRFQICAEQIAICNENSEL